MSTTVPPGEPEQVEIVEDEDVLTGEAEDEDDDPAAGDKN